MKKLLAIIFLFLFMASTASGIIWYKDRILTAKVSATKSADALIRTGAGIFHGIIFETDGTNDVDFIVYNGLNVTGTAITPTNLTITGSDNIGGIGFDPPIYCDTGIYVDITLSAGTCTYLVQYDY